MICYTQSRWFLNRFNSKGLGDIKQQGQGQGTSGVHSERDSLLLRFDLSPKNGPVSHFTYFTVLTWQSQATNQLCAKGTPTVHKIFIYISMMGFLPGMKNDQVRRKVPRVNGRDNGFDYALRHQILNGVAVHALVPSHLPVPLAVDKYPYL